MKLISWNVNGLRACAGKGFFDFFASEDADFSALEKPKCNRIRHPLKHRATFSTGTVPRKRIFRRCHLCKREPLSVSYGLGIDEHDHEGRVITLEYDNFYLVTVYTPNSQNELVRLDYRMQWEDDFRAYVCNLDKKKPVIICGDMNVAHQEIDLKTQNQPQNAGFTDEERQKMTELLASGFTDTFRAKNPDATGIYSWWSYRFKAREKNAGWRIDYFLVSNRLMDKVSDTRIYTDIMGSDHCPVGLTIDL